MSQRCAGNGVQELTAGVGVFQQELEQDQEWIFLIRTGPRAEAGVIFSHSAFDILMIVCALRAICDMS